MLKQLTERYPELSCCEAELKNAKNMMIETYRSGGKILVCGNGGSCADSDHIVGELMKGFLQKREMSLRTAEKFRSALGEENARPFIEKLQCAVPAISLPAQSALLSAYANDVDAKMAYAQLVFGYAKKEDLLIAISTSGNSENIVAAAMTAKALGVRSIALTGATESSLSRLCDCTVRVPETETFKVQELHLPVYHYLCAATEKELFG